MQAYFLLLLVWFCLFAICFAVSGPGCLRRDVELQDSFAAASVSTYMRAHADTHTHTAT